MTSINERQLRRKIFFSKEPQEVVIKKFKEEEKKFQEEEKKFQEDEKKFKEDEKKFKEDEKKIEELKGEYKNKQQIQQEQPIQNKDYTKDIKYHQITYPNNIKNKALTVVIAHYNENLDWTSNLQYPYIIISRNGLPREKAPNKGNEASSFLEYIINNYDNLTEYTLFVHGHRTSWHHKSNTDERVNNNLSLNKPYYNINELKIDKILIGNDEYIKMLEKICHISYDRRNKHTYRAGAQFYINKNNILRNSKESYIELYNFLMNTTLSSAISGRFFEYSWHIIFTHKINDVE